MTTLFDGMAGALSDVFGAPVVLTYPDGTLQTVQAVLRSEPLEIPGEAGTVWIEEPTLRIRRDLAPNIARGVVATNAGGTSYRVESRITSGSPALDGFFICTLELVP